MSTRLVMSARVLRSLCILAGLLWNVTATCATQAPESTRQSTVLVLLDGFRADLVDPEQTPHLHRLAQSGARGAMIPVWPTISSPNHWAIVTGLHPRRSGIIHNDMYNPATGEFLDPVGFEASTGRYLDSPSARRFWGHGEPIWASVARQGGTSGMIGQWAGWRAEGNKPSWQIAVSAPHHGRDTRAELLLAALDQDGSSRPDLLTLYSLEVDHAQHEFGVGSNEARAALSSVDRLVGEIVAGLEQKQLTGLVNIVVTADHGMLNIGEGQVVYLDDFVKAEALEIRPVGTPSPSVSLWPKPGQEAQILAALRRVPHIHPLRPNEIPVRFQCCHPSIAPPILVTADAGWVIKMRKEASIPLMGMHGYDNQLTEMQAAFIAAGPAIRSGVRLEPFPTVDIYPLLTTLLNIEPQDNDGSLKPLCPILKAPPAECSRAAAAVTR